MKERIFYILLFSVLVFQTKSIARTDWQNMLKNENGVVIEQSQEVHISVSDQGQLVIIAHNYEMTDHFNDNAKLYSEQSIGYSEAFTEITDIEAYSMVPNQKGKLKKIKVEDFVTTDSRSSGIFYDDQKKISFVYPALKAGSQTVLSFKKEYKEPRLWGYYMFSSFFPVEKSEYKVVTSDAVKLKYVLYGIDEDKVSFSKESKGSKVTYTWHAEELDRIHISRGADGVLHTAPHLIIYVDSYEFNGEKREVLGGVADLHAWYEKFIEGIDDDADGSLDMMVKNIIEGKSTELEKVEAIYYWVQQNIKYIAIEDGLGGFRPRSANTVFNRRYGDCKDMSNLLHNMLNIAEIPSNLAWIGTKSIPYSHIEVPTPMADNHMICTYKDGDQYYFLDATDQHNILGMPTSHIQGREALVHKGSSNFELVNVPVVDHEQNAELDSVIITINDNKLNGQGKVLYNGYNRIPITNNLENLKEEDRKVFLNAILSKGNNTFSLSSVQTSNLAEKNAALKIEYEFLIDDYLMSTGNEIYLNPHLDKDLEGEIIDLSQTKKAIHYPYKKLSTKVFCLEVPENYEVTYLPKNQSYSEEDFGFDLNYSLEKDVVVTTQTIKINTIKLDTDQFDSWNKMVKELFAAYKESIVLKMK